MRKQQQVALAVIVVLIIAIPAVVFATFSSSKLEQFLKHRESVLVRLDQNAASLPVGVQHWIQPLASRRPTFPEKDHITSVVNGGTPWHQDGHSSYALNLSDEVAEKPVRDVAMMLEAHFADGLQSFGMNSPVKGLSGSLGHGQATQARWWRDRDGHLIVTFAVFVDRASKTAHVERFVHERFD